MLIYFRKKFKNFKKILYHYYHDNFTQVVFNPLFKPHNRTKILIFLVFYSSLATRCFFGMNLPEDIVFISSYP